MPPPLELLPLSVVVVWCSLTVVVDTGVCAELEAGGAKPRRTVAVIPARARAAVPG